jgi:endopeptidase La
MNLSESKLKIFLKYLKFLFNKIIINLKNDNISNDLKISIDLKLSTIAELSVCNEIINNFLKDINKYSNKSINYFLNNFKKKYNIKNDSNKKQKINNSFIQIEIMSLDENNDDINHGDIGNDVNNGDDDDEDNGEHEEHEEEEEEEDDDEENEEEEDDDYCDENNNIKINKKTMYCEEIFNQIFKNNKKNTKNEIIKYLSTQPLNKKKEIFKNIKEIINYQKCDKPVPFKIMNLPLSISQKNNILKTYTTLESSVYPENKLRTWFDAVMTIPFGIYKGINLETIERDEIKKFLNKLKDLMNIAVYGHDEAKHQIVQIMGQQIRNPEAKGNIIGLWGPMGTGKTSLIKEGIAKAMNKPFIFISLGGATDASFLDGHSYTYEGSIYGRIANGLINCKCMDPIIYFDELDKISKTHKGDEILNLLIHLTDPVQNSNFRDKYFHGIDLDLSRVTMIFSYNDPSNINPILLDRITSIETKYLLTSQKIYIAKNYLLPNILKDIGLNKNDITLDDKLLTYIIDSYTREGGVRKLKSLLYIITRELNLLNLLKKQIFDIDIVFPFNVQINHLNILLKNKIIIESDKIHTQDKIGIINGLYACSTGIGGILPIQVLWIPTQSILSLKATGSLEKVIKESTDVACSLAWNYLSVDEKKNYLSIWKDSPMGFHIHCPDGAVPKDGPSAGAALTLALYSLLTNRKIKHDIAITGEINLEGNITCIGGLEEKLEGAKKAGVKLVLVPKENNKHLEKIKERNSLLLDNNFKVILVESLNDAINYALK